MFICYNNDFYGVFNYLIILSYINKGYILSHIKFKSYV